MRIGVISLHVMDTERNVIFEKKSEEQLKMVEKVERKRLGEDGRTPRGQNFVGTVQAENMVRLTFHYELSNRSWILQSFPVENTKRVRSNIQILHAKRG